MPEAVYHQLIMLRPMQAGVGGYARVQGETGRQLVQINLRGLRGGGIRAFWYAGEGLVRELGASPANARGEAALYTDLPVDAIAPRRLTALLITDGEAVPRPLAIGLCTSQSAGSLMDARNALLALCERLGRAVAGAAVQEREKAAGAAAGAALAAAVEGLAEAVPGDGSAADAAVVAAPGSGCAPGRAGEAEQKEPSGTTRSGQREQGGCERCGQGSGVASGNAPAAKAHRQPEGDGSGPLRQCGVAMTERSRNAAPTADEQTVASEESTAGKAAAEAGSAPRPAGSAPDNALPRELTRRRDTAPREVFLPAIDVERERRRRRRGEPDEPVQGAVQEVNGGIAAAAARQGAAETVGTAAPGQAAAPAAATAEDAVPGRRSATAAQPSARTALAHSKGSPSPTVRPADSEAGGPAAPDETVASSAAPMAPGRAAQPVARPVRHPDARPADRLPPLVWPEAFESIASWFDRCPAVPLLPWPGWRFVQVQQGQGALWVGCQRQEGRIARIAYALPEHAPVPEGKPFRPALAADGQTVQVLVLRP